MGKLVKYHHPPGSFFMVELVQGIFALPRWESFPPFFSQFFFFCVGMCIRKTRCNMGMLLDTSNTFSVPSCVLLYFESCMESPVSTMGLEFRFRMYPPASFQHVKSVCTTVFVLLWPGFSMEHDQGQLHLKWDAGWHGGCFMFIFYFTPILREMIHDLTVMFLRLGFSTKSSEHWKIWIPTTSVILSNWFM